MKNINSKDIIEFLRESNAIEGVYDDNSYAQALYAWSYLLDQPVLTPGVMLKTHKILMLHQPLAPNEKGYFRTIPVYIGGKEAPNYRNIRYGLLQWCDASLFLTEKSQEKTEVQIKIGANLIQQMHVEYERIHPFVDGNGRTGRLFMNWQRIKIGLPILVIKEQEKQVYYKWFQ